MTTTQLLRSFCLVGKVTEAHAKEIEEILIAHHAALAKELTDALRKRHTREMNVGENLGKYLAFQRGEEHMRKKALNIIQEIIERK